MPPTPLNLSVIGAGHVGLVTAACLAEVGHRLIVIENDPVRLDLLNQDPPQVPIYEPGLQELVEKLRADRPEDFRFTDSIFEAVEETDAAFVCVGTPQGESGEADLFYVEKVASSIAEALAERNRQGYLVIEKSTVPVRTGQSIRRVMERVLAGRNRSEVSFEVASNPEFLAEGTALRDFFYPYRVVVGVESERGGEILRGVYQPLLQRKFDWAPPGSLPDEFPEAEFLETDVQSAELIKHASNSFLALKISFINAVANVCERSGADVREVARGMGLDPRIGPRFLNAGAGFGGYCFPKDVAAFHHISSELGYPFDLLKDVLEINERQKQLVIEKLRKALWNLKAKTIAVWGLAFKPNTEDLRGAPALDLIRSLLDQEAEVRAYDPAVRKLPPDLQDRVALTDSAGEAARGADAILLVTEWDEFAALSDEQLKEIQKGMNLPVVIDARNLFEPSRLRVLGFEYYGIGVP